MLALVAWGLAPGADAAPPTNGPSVLFKPFYYRNPSESPLRPRDAPPAFESWSGLLGPLYWTNPRRGGVSTSVEIAPVSDDYWARESRFARDDRSHDRYTSPVKPVQGREPVDASPVPREPAVIPIPSETIPTPGGPNQPGGGGDADSLAEAESLGEEPEEPRLQFLRTQTVLLEPGELQCDYGLTYVLSENDFASVVDVGAGPEVREAHLKQRQLFIPLEFRLGVTPRMQVFANIPIGWSHNEFAVFDAIDVDESDGGLGDINLGTSLLLFEDPCSDTECVFTFAATLPTGDSPFVTGTTGFGQPSLGDNFWAVSGDLLWINTYDPVVVFYGVGYRHQFEREFEGIMVDPGEEARVQLGVGFAVNQNVTLSTRFAASFIGRTEFDDDSLEGSFTEPMSVRMAATVLRCQRIIEPFVEFGTTDDATATAFGITWTQ